MPVFYVSFLFCFFSPAERNFPNSGIIGRKYISVTQNQKTVKLKKKETLKVLL